MLRKKTNGTPRRAGIETQTTRGTVDRRTFLRGSGLTIGGLTAIAATGGTVTASPPPVGLFLWGQGVDPGGGKRVGGIGSGV